MKTDIALIRGLGGRITTAIDRRYGFASRVYLLTSLTPVQDRRNAFHQSAVCVDRR